MSLWSIGPKIVIDTLIDLFQMVCLDIDMEGTRRTPASPSGQCRLDALRRTVDTLWASEPCAPAHQRPGLFERLARLERDVELLALHLHGGNPLDDELLDACAAEGDELLRTWQPTDRDDGRRAA